MAERSPAQTGLAIPSPSSCHLDLGRRIWICVYGTIKIRDIVHTPIEAPLEHVTVNIVKPP